MQRKRIVTFTVATVFFILLISSLFLPILGNITTQNCSGSNNQPLSASSSFFEVTFNETGLTDQEWFVTFNSITVNTTMSALHFYVPPGNYSYSISGPLGYSPSISNGTVSVAYQSINLQIKFIKLSVFIFNENGLPVGSKWTIFINGTNYSSKNSTMTIILPKGNYSYNVKLPLFYGASVPSGVVGPSSDSITIYAIHQSTEYILIIIILVVIDASILAFLIRRRKKRKSEAS